MLLTRLPVRRAGWSGAAVRCGTRPLGAAVLVTAAGGWLIVLPFLGTPVALLQPGVAGSAGLGVSLPLLLSGVALMRFPALHALVGLLATVLSVLALLTCNLGGLFLGTALGVLGGCLAFAWTPPAPPAPQSAPVETPVEKGSDKACRTA
ncbi:hypothetical protein E0500_022640 [Streptomyces sp. KM273126]|uniref:DUF6114 domain-containing protein n=1 Tax=Streptomyces sp. KM273126 TaxID=2545247 RepID=UPI001040730B|nr:DUF6114 domain-containing protein [Streptomyces sp. KM273126]MBA2810117.1 hypothetical protein [Streptomyces sp. KM273126]